MVEERTVPARDGYDLAVTVLGAGDEPAPTVIISAGVGFKKIFYERYASFLSERGFRVVLYDYRGIGGSAPASLRGFDATLSEWGLLDLNGIYDWVCQRYPTSDLVALGHSVGCLLIGLCDHVESLEASVFVTPPHAYWGHWPGLHRVWMVGVMYGLIPLSTRLTGYFPGRAVGFGENLPRGVALEWARWCRSRDYLFDHVDDEHLCGYENVTAPTLSFSFTDDLYAPPGSVRAALAHYPNAPVTKREMSPEDLEVDAIGHLGFFHDRFRETLWNESVGWMKSILEEA